MMALRRDCDPDSDACTEGKRACVAGAWQCTDTSGDSAETCNKVDDDCDAAIDEIGVAPSGAVAADVSAGGTFTVANAVIAQALDAATCGAATTQVAWFKLVIPAGPSRKVGLTTYGTSYDTILTVYQNDNVSSCASSEVTDGCSDDYTSCGAVTWSSVAVTLAPGTSWIAVRPKTEIGRAHR